MAARKQNREAKKREKALRRQEWERKRQAKQVANTGNPTPAQTGPAMAGEVLLYHGTSGRRAEAMNTQGIIPRQDGACNWPDRPGRPDCVYLTSVWGLTYALHALTRSASIHANEEGAILEVRGLDKSLVLPDEDFLFECVTMYYPEREAAERGEHLIGTVLPEIRDELENYAGQDWLDRLSRKYDGRVHDWASHFSGQFGWEASLAGLGTCAYRGTIPPSHIKGIAFFPGNHPAFADISRLKPTSSEHLSLKAGLETVTSWVFQRGPGLGHAVFKDQRGFRLTSRSS
jgi:hypothetical protein